MTRKSKRRAAVVAALVVATGACCGGLLTDWAGRHRRALAPLVAKLDAEEPGWRVGELDLDRNAALPPAESNAAAQILAAIKLAPTTHPEWNKAEPFWTAPPTNHLPDAAAVAAGEALHAASAEALSVARKLRGLPRGGVPMTFATPNPFATLLPDIQNLRQGAYLLTIDSAIAANRGDGGAALDAAIATLNVASGGAGDEPNLIAQLVRIAVAAIAVSQAERALAWTEPPGAQLAELQRRLLEEREVPRLVYGYRGERASLFRICDGIGDGSLTLGGMGAGPAPGSLADVVATRFVRGGFRRAQVVLLGQFDELMVAAKLPDPERDDATDAIMKRLARPGTIPSVETMVNMVFPAAEKCSQAETRVRAQLGSAAVAVACERFRRANGRWPASLGEIPPDILSAIPADPYTGKPLLYRVLPDGVAVYSTGFDRADDGGTDLRARYIKGSPAGGDVGVRLWNPDLRRAPPLPPKPAGDGE